MNEMTKEELIAITIDNYTNLQKIKKANGETENKELDYQIKCTTAKLSAFGISVEDLTLS
ncbi:MAG: hypothetical protein ACI4FX_11690 [Agathobacter sp.]